MSTSQAAFFSDWQVFGVTAAAAGGGGGAGAVLTGPSGAATLITAAAGNPAVNRTLQIGLGNGVAILANTNAAAAGITANSSFTAVSKHLQGDTYFGVDGDTTAVFIDADDGSNGTPLAAGDSPASTTGDDFTGVDAPSGADWVVK